MDWKIQAVSKDNRQCEFHLENTYKTRKEARKTMKMLKQALGEFAEVKMYKKTTLPNNPITRWERRR